MKTNNIFYIFLYFILFLIIALLIPPLSTGLGKPLPFSATILQIYHYWGGSDPGSFALGGWTIFSKGSFGTGGPWPPGFMFLYAILLTLFGPKAPAVILIQILAALFLAITCNLFRLCIEHFLRKRYITLFPLVLLMFPQFRIFMLDRSGVLLGETFAISFALTGFFCLILAYAKDKKEFALFAGLAFALSAYFRPQYETFFMVASINFLIIFFSIQLYKKFKRDYFLQNTKNSLSVINVSPITIIFLALVIFQVFTMPYRIFNHMRGDSLSWVNDGPTIWQQNFTSTETLTQAGGGFEAQGMGNTACRVDTALCEKLNIQIINNSISSEELRKNVLMTLFKHPLHWAYLKFRILPNYWFATINNFWDMVAYSSISSISAYIENSIFLGCFIFSAIWTFYTLKNPYSFITYWFGSSIFIAYALIFTLVHYEVRYFFFFKFYFLITAILGIVQLASKQFAIAQYKSTLHQ